MKNIIIILLALFTLLNEQPICQSLIDSLTSNNHDIIFNKLKEIVEQNRIETIPVLHNTIEQSDPYVQLQFLHTLDALNDRDIRVLTHDLINRADEFEVHEVPENPLFAKADASGILFKYNDFSTAEFLIQYIEINKPNVCYFLDLLPYVYKNVPAYRQVIKNDLVNILENAEYETNSFIALKCLIESAGTEALMEIVSAFVNNSKPSVRILAFEGLVKLNYQALNSLLKSRINIDSDQVIRLEIADTLLLVFGAPSDLNSVIEYQLTEPDPTAKSLMAYSINSFIPPRPTVTTEQMIKNLITYNAQLYQYGWIQEYNTCQQYVALLDKIENEYMTVSQNDLCDDLKILLAQTDSNLSGHLITTEAYKFFHYHGIYIKENVETELGTCP